MNFPTQLAGQTIPLTKELVGPDGAPVIDRLAEAGYEVHAGLTPEYADAIHEMSLEPAIRKYCPKDCTKRFKDRAAAEVWVARQRGAFLLLKKSGDDQLELAGYGWVGPYQSPKVPSAETTFAIRIGQDFQGQGLAEPFSRLIILGAIKLYGAKHLSLSAWESNGGAIHIYHKLGFRDVFRETDERKELDGSSIQDTRVYMELPHDQLTP